MMVREAGMAEAADHQQPVGPIGINQNVPVGTLDQKGSVPDPGDTDLAMLQFWEERRLAVAMAAFARKKGGKKYIGNKTVRLLPAGMGYLRFHA